MSSGGATGERSFDGIVCFGGVDWWYHNRGHYDLQMMRELSRVVPVLYVNSIAMRVPRLSERGGMFFKRVRRKWRSLRRGLCVVRPGFGVFSPLLVPGRLGTALSRAVAPRQVRAAARALGIERPLAWVACPPAVHLLDGLAPRGLVYQRTDRFEAFQGVDPAFIGACNDALVERADLVLYCSSLLLEEEAARTPRAFFLDHGVDYEPFREAGDGAPEPPDVAGLPRPRAGFVGGIDRHTFDPKLLREVAARLPEVTFVLVGACSLEPGWCDAPNVHLLGQRPYEEVARYMAACDVLLMPWNDSEWIRACNPVKLKEYLAVGRPVVTTDFHELRGYPGLVRVARGADAFAAAIRAALASYGAAERDAGRARVREETWGHKAQALLARLEELGLRPRARGAAGAPKPVGSG